MRSQNRKVNNIGRAGCLELLALGLALVNPVSSAGLAFAEEVPSDKTPEFIGEIENGEAAVDDGIAVLADTPSTVGISFSLASGSASLTPTTSAGQSAQVNVLTTVNVQNSGGYSVYLKSNSVNLVGTKSTSNIIPGATTAKTYANMDANTWGYYASESGSVPENAIYKAVSVSGNGDKIAENTMKKIASDTKKIMLSFAAKINDQKPADTYKNTLTVSVVSSPLQTTLSDIANMQDMTSAICSASANYESKQLKDVRDGKYYWVTKLGDGKCWMTQNLDLDLTNGTFLSSVTSDLGWTGAAYPTTAKTWNPPYTTATTATADTILADNTGTRSWSLGNYRITNSDISSDCGSAKNSAADCTSQFTVYNTPTTANGETSAHYILGNHYQWNAATAGTGSTITSGTAFDSICPRNWRLPTSDTGGEFAALVTALGGTSSTNNITKSPFYGVRGGGVYQNTNLFLNAGHYGIYWSSTPNSNYNSAYNLNFYNIAGVDPSYGGSPRDNGFSVRCVAR